MGKLFGEWWAAIWPNLAASGLTFGSGLLWAQRRALVLLEERERKLLAHHQITHDLVKALHDRLDRIENGCPDDSIRT